MTAAGVNAAEPRPLLIVPCGRLRHGNANDLHVRRDRYEAKDAFIPIPLAREAGTFHDRTARRSLRHSRLVVCAPCARRASTPATPSHSRQDDRRRTSAWRKRGRRIVQPLQPEDRAKTANKMNGLDRKFCIAPMMDWTESLGGSMAWRRACARLAHVRSPFLLLSFLSAARACT